MSDFKTQLFDKCRALPLRVVLPEAEDPRIIEAARIVLQEKLASEVVLLGEEASLPGDPSRIPGARVVNPRASADVPAFQQTLFDLRKSKGMTEEQALKEVQTPIPYGALMLKTGQVDAMVSGSLTPTALTVRAGLTIIRPREGIRTVSGAFLMLSPQQDLGEEGALLFADCAVNPYPTAEQLCDIAVSSARSFRQLIGKEAKVAFLSFSTKGSASHLMVEKVQQALECMRERSDVDFAYDGEMQLDAALVPTVAQLKAPQSPVAGQANVLIFPDLNAGNIGYKLVERFGNAEAVGPVLQGLSAPLNDLSRGATVPDIVTTIAMTLLQAM